MGRHMLDFVHLDDRDKLQQIWPDHFDVVNSVDLRLNRSNIWCAAHWIRFHESEQQLVRSIVVLSDTSKQHRHAQELWTLAHTDLLTGLPNRNLFLDSYNQALTLAKRLALGAAVFWIDLDGFKAVNDRLGHAAGDAVLQQVAQRLKSSIRSSDTVARIGGDEFAIILTDVDGAESAEQLAQLLVLGLRKTYELPQGLAPISASIGIAMYPQHACSVEDLMRLADAAMYGAKRAGKDQVQMAQSLP